MHLEEKGVMESSLSGDGGCEIKPSAHSPGQPTLAARGWVGHGDLQSPLPTSAILRFWEPIDELCFVQFLQFLTAFLSHGCTPISCT